MKKPNFKCFNWNSGYRDAVCKEQCMICRMNNQDAIKESNEEIKGTELL